MSRWKRARANFIWFKPISAGWCASRLQHTLRRTDSRVRKPALRCAKSGTFVATELGVGLGIQSERAEMRWSDASDAQQGGHIGHRERFRKIEPLYVSATPGFQQRELRGSFHSLDNHLDIECACQAKSHCDRGDSQSIALSYRPCRSGGLIHRFRRVHLQYLFSPKNLFYLKRLVAWITTTPPYWSSECGSAIPVCCDFELSLADGKLKL